MSTCTNGGCQFTLICEYNHQLLNAHEFQFAKSVHVIKLKLKRLTIYSNVRVTAWMATTNRTIKLKQIYARTHARTYNN